MNIFRDIFHGKLSETMDTDDRGDRVENKLLLMHRKNRKEKTISGFKNFFVI